MMLATVCWRSTRYLQRRLSSSSSSTTPALLLLLTRRCSQTRIKSSLALSSSARTEQADLKNDDSSVLHGQNNALKNKPTTIVRPPRASNAQSSFHRVKLTPAKDHQQQQQQVSNNEGAPAAAAAAARATCAAPRSFVRIKPLVAPQKSTIVADGGGGAFIMESSSSSLLRQNQQQHKAQHHQQQDNTYRQEQQQQQQEPPQYWRHGKNNNKQNNNTNSSSSSPTAAVPVPKSCWVQVDGISPLSSLDAILASVQTALEQQQQQEANDGIILDLDGGDSNADCSPWVVEHARVILSPFARPTGWFLKFRNPSIVQALLTHAHDHPIQSGWKIVNIKECTDDSDDKDKEEPIVSDATLRIENCSHDTTTYDLMNMFSRFDLAVPRRLSSSFPSVQEWKGAITTPNDGRLHIHVAPPPGTFLVHFADASWARAALREKQGMVFKGRQLRLAQYPRQI